MSLCIICKEKEAIYLLLCHSYCRFCCTCYDIKNRLIENPLSEEVSDDQRKAFIAYFSKALTPEDFTRYITLVNSHISSKVCN